jgi:hypothetical protein
MEEIAHDQFSPMESFSSQLAILPVQKYLTKEHKSIEALLV